MKRIKLFKEAFTLALTVEEIYELEKSNLDNLLDLFNELSDNGCYLELISVRLKMATLINNNYFSDLCLFEILNENDLHFRQTGSLKLREGINLTDNTLENIRKSIIYVLKVRSPHTDQPYNMEEWLENGLNSYIESVKSMLNLDVEDHHKIDHFRYRIVFNHLS
jgi:hypothetical protein